MDNPTVEWDERRYNECGDKILPYLAHKTVPNFWSCNARVNRTPWQAAQKHTATVQRCVFFFVPKCNFAVITLHDVQTVGLTISPNSFERLDRALYNDSRCASPLIERGDPRCIRGRFVRLFSREHTRGPLAPSTRIVFTIRRRTPF